MDKLHRKFAEQFSWYQKWHTGAQVTLIHFLVLMAFVSAITLLLQTPLVEYSKEQLAAAAASTRDTYAPGKLLIQFKTGVKEADEEPALKAHGAKKVGSIPEIRVHIISVPQGAEEKVRAALARNPRVQFVELDYRVPSDVIPNDPYYPSEWHAPKIGLPEAWDTTIGSSAVTVAVLDAQVHPNPDFVPNLVTGYNARADRGDPGTPNACQHGTNVAGVIGNIGNNGVGTAGVSWNTKIMPIVIGDASCYGLYSDQAEAIIYATDHGVRVINLSYSGPNSSATLESAINYARSKGALFFASAGNTGNNTPGYPAAVEAAISVGATASNDTRASWSSYGPTVDIVAPGAGIYTSTSATGYGAKSGTSFSSPMVAGLAALVWSVNPNLSNTQVWEVIRQNADDLGTAGRDDYFGWGRINAARTIAAAKLLVPATDTTKPTTSLTAPASGTTLTGEVSVTANASDNVGVSRVEFMTDGKLAATDTASPYGFFWDTALEAVGSHTLQTKAYDAAGNTSSPALVNVTVTRPAEVGSTTDMVAPVVTITSPANGTKIKGKGSVTVSATASDPSGIGSLTIAADGATIGSCQNVTTCSATWSGKSITAGSHTITVTAVDTSANRNSGSKSVMITK